MKNNLFKDMQKVFYSYYDSLDQPILYGTTVFETSRHSTNNPLYSACPWCNFFLFSNEAFNGGSFSLKFSNIQFPPNICQESLHVFLNYQVLCSGNVKGIFLKKLWIFLGTRYKTELGWYQTIITICQWR